MASRSRVGLSFLPTSTSATEPHRELFEACRNGDITKVKKLVNSANVNAKDTAGRKSSPLHFAAGKYQSTATPYKVNHSVRSQSVPSMSTKTMKV